MKGTIPLSLATVLVTLGFSLPADADVWKWVDANGKTYFVDTTKPIFTWVDEFGKAHYSDTPGHEDAVSVELVWHSSGTLKDVEGPTRAAARTPGQRAEHDEEKAQYCQRATEVYDAYVNAPQLYRTNENGEREYLSRQEAAAIIAETKAKRDRFCS
jgi:hypothetical protein